MLLGGAGSAYMAYDASVKMSEHKNRIAAISKQSQEMANDINGINNKLDSVGGETYYRYKSIEHAKKEVSRSMERLFRCTITGYDLSVQSCGKTESHPEYGVTATGSDLSGHTLYSARAIAVDPDVIPLGSKVRIKFDNKEMSRYNGIYTAVDTGSAITGNRIDLFFGDFGSGSVSQEALEFGVQTALVEII